MVKPLWQIANSGCGREDDYCYDRIWYVVFMPHENVLPWWQKLLIRKHPPKLGHVALYSPVSDTHALLIDSTKRCVHIELREFAFPVHKVMKEISRDLPVLMFRHDAQSSKHITNLVPTCVSLAKAVMGLKCWAVTPKGLYLHLLSNGASILFAE